MIGDKMKKILVVLIALLIVSPFAFAARQGSPYPPYLDQRFDQSEDAIDVLELASDDSVEGQGLARKFSKAIYDVSSDGGSSVSHGLGVSIPAGALVTGVYVYINTAFADGSASSSSLALECEDTRNLMEYKNMELVPISALLYGSHAEPTAASSSSFIPSAANGAGSISSGLGSIGSACEVKAVVRGDAGYVPYTAGKATAVIEYFDKE